MSFAFPLALLGLIGIPIVILIYILQSKYNEQIISSTYIWKLSDRFLKRKNPLSGLTGLISLILQILMVTAISLLLARPMFTLPNGADQYYFVLDASGSMSMADGDTTRFENAKDEIVRVIKRSTQGSTYTLACVSGETETVFVDLTNKDTAIRMVEELAPADTSATHLALFEVAQERFDDEPSSLIYVVTDKGYTSCENAEIIHVGSEATNYAITAPTFSHASGTLKAGALLTSYGHAADISVRLTVDGQTKEERVVKLQANEPTAVEFSC
ncbi:MAG: BatA and WFA domain-containing protein, partial [Clostridia bacterium]|nr:BatA and WFA domain-containing protein [Clostridia bacterium]